MLAFKLAIVDQCQCILLCVRILLANLTPFSTTSETLSYGQWLLVNIIWQCVSIGVTQMYVYKALAKEELSQGQHRVSKIQFGCKVYNIQSLLGQMVGPNSLKVSKH